jgi:hypothetical protein
MEINSKFLDDSMATWWTSIMGHPLPLLVMAVILGAFFLFAITLRSRSRKVNGIPFAGMEYGALEKRKQKFLHEAGSLLQQGYDQVRAAHEMGFGYHMTDTIKYSSHTAYFKSQLKKVCR